MPKALSGAAAVEMETGDAQGRSGTGDNANGRTVEVEAELMSLKTKRKPT
mgnify:CR=1 FL=1